MTDQTYYYDEVTQTLMDSSGTKIRVGESFDGINEKKWAENHFFFCTPSIPLA